MTTAVGVVGEGRESVFYLFRIVLLLRLRRRKAVNAASGLFGHLRSVGIRNDAVVGRHTTTSSSLFGKRRRYHANGIIRLSIISIVFG